MELLDPPPKPGAAPQPSRLAAPPAPGDSFRELIGQIGREIAAPMSSALERVNAFAASGRMDRAGLRALRDEIECARRLGLSAQQLSRFASGRVHQNPRRLNLAQTLRDALAQRQRETEARGIDLRHELKSAELMIDASMLSALLQALLDWSFEHARSRIEFDIDVKHWPAHARLSCRFAFVPADQMPSAEHRAAERLDTLPWQLLRRLAQTLGLALRRDDGHGSTQATLEFPQTLNEGLLSLDGLGADDTAPTGPNSQPMVGRHVLVIAARREIRNGVRDTLRTMGLMVDYVASVDEAREFCGGGLPHAIIYEAALAGDNFRMLRAQWAQEVPTLAFIEIAEQGREIEVCDLGGQRVSRIGRDVVASALGSALLFELSQG